MFELYDIVYSFVCIGLELIVIDQGVFLDLDLWVELVFEGVLVIGIVVVLIVGECVCCFSLVWGCVQVVLIELFVYLDSVIDEIIEEDEVGCVVDEIIDFEQLIIDVVGLELLFLLVCWLDCLGFCLQCGVLLVSELGYCYEQIDLWWVKLVEMFGLEFDIL